MAKCKYCKKEFKPDTKHNQVYCNPKCREKYYLNKRKDKNGEIVKSCVVCGKKWVYGKKHFRLRYCSEKCFKKIYWGWGNKKPKAKLTFTTFKINFKDKIYTLWEYDKKTFGGSKLYALIRDGFKCQLCNSDNNLTVHHKDGKGCNLPLKERNNDLNNLITLCKNCHDSVEDINEDVEYCHNYIMDNKKELFRQLKNMLK